MVFARCKPVKKSSQKNFCLGKIWALGVGIFLVALVFSYIVQINSVVIQNYTLEESKRKLRFLESQNQELNLKASDLTLLSQKEALQKKLQLVEVENAFYIKAGSSEISWRPVEE